MIGQSVKLLFCQFSYVKREILLKKWSLLSGVNEPKCYSKNKISHGNNNNNKNKQELTAKSKTQWDKQKPHGKKKEREKVKTLFLTEPSLK